MQSGFRSTAGGAALITDGVRDSIRTELFIQIGTAGTKVNHELAGRGPNSRTTDVVGVLTSTLLSQESRSTQCLATNNGLLRCCGGLGESRKSTFIRNRSPDEATCQTQLVSRGAIKTKLRVVGSTPEFIGQRLRDRARAGLRRCNPGRSVRVNWGVKLAKNQK